MSDAYARLRGRQDFGLAPVNFRMVESHHVKRFGARRTLVTILQYVYAVRVYGEKKTPALLDGVGSKLTM